MQPHRRHQPAIEWAQSYLLTHGYDLQGAPQMIRAMPWSVVTHFSTSKGSVYLKEMAPLFSLEPTLIKTLTQWDSESVPKIISINNDLSCFLMEDAGTPLSQYLKEDVNIDILAKALAMCANSQRKAVDHVDALIALGVPDWRLANLPDLYRQLLKEEIILKADGVTGDEIKALHNLYPRLVFLCEGLSKHNIQETLEHTDFHGNNIFIKNDQLIIGDWGDAVISHPFYSLVSYLNSATRYHGLREGGGTYTYLQNIYLDKWGDVEAKEHLLEAFALSKKLKPVQIALSFIRVKMCPNFDSSFDFSGYISKALREFIETET